MTPAHSRSCAIPRAETEPQQREQDSGFALIELLVVTLILGILAAIALAMFFDQKEKAGDAGAKEYAHAATVAMESCGTENGGSYASCSAAKLRAIEPALESATVTVPRHRATEYELVSESRDKNKFRVKNASGTLTFSCTKAGTGGCPSGGDWNEG